MFDPPFEVPQGLCFKYRAVKPASMPHCIHGRTPKENSLSELRIPQDDSDDGKVQTSEGEASEAPKAKKHTAPKMPEKKKKKAWPRNIDKH